jgi:hypothetical protein
VEVGVIKAIMMTVYTLLLKSSIVWHLHSELPSSKVKKSCIWMTLTLQIIMSKLLVAREPHLNERTMKRLPKLK